MAPRQLSRRRGGDEAGGEEWQSRHAGQEPRGTRDLLLWEEEWRTRELSRCRILEVRGHLFLPGGRLPRKQVGRPATPSGHGIVAFDLPFYFIFGVFVYLFILIGGYQTVPVLQGSGHTDPGGKYEVTEWIGYNFGVIFDFIMFSGALTWLMQ